MKGINNTIKWRLKESISFTDSHLLIYRATFMRRKVQMEITTLKGNDHDWDMPVTKYYIEDIKKEFDTIEDFIKYITQ